MWEFFYHNLDILCHVLTDVSREKPESERRFRGFQQGREITAVIDGILKPQGQTCVSAPGEHTGSPLHIGYPMIL
jgi:hypothetical protein